MKHNQAFNQDSEISWNRSILINVSSAARDRKLTQRNILEPFLLGATDTVF